MALREFKDSTGTDWLAWDVPPLRRYPQARESADRRVQPTPGFTPERRVSPDRRVRRATGLESGWVCFQSAAEKRRLVPPPRGWDAYSDRELEGLCHQSTRLGR
ncbi:MAG TPA: hypothetical protein VFE05_06160 [Longimicrobiaceae bacterium]|jgi:hypothetical protein|nr:hypothetical protein [Longimicrobiaceae bacterium]